MTKLQKKIKTTIDPDCRTVTEAGELADAVISAEANKFAGSVKWGAEDDRLDRLNLTQLNKTLNDVRRRKDDRRKVQKTAIDLVDAK